MEINKTESNINFEEIIKSLKEQPQKYYSVSQISSIEGRSKSSICKSLKKYSIKTFVGRDYNSGGQEILLVPVDELKKYLEMKYLIHSVFV